MQITDIEISCLSFDAARGLHTANVGIAFADRFVVLFCSAALPGGAGDEDRDFALTYDALRQLRRMPEFRSGQARLELPPLANPLPLAA
ncbi:MAG: hypothetical protein AB7E21_01050 [Pseudodonghicola sp.]